MINNSTQDNFTRYKKYSTDLARYYRLPAVQTSLSIVLSIFISAIFIVAAIRPTLVTITKLNKTIEESTKTLEQLEAKAQALQNISQTWEEIKPLKTYVDRSLPMDGPHYQSLINSMEILAIEAQVELSSESFGEALIYSSINDPYSGKNMTVIEMPYSVRVSGTYPQIKDFFAKLNNLDRVVSIESIGFAKEIKSRDGNTNSLAFNLTGAASYLADESQLANILSSLKDKRSAEAPKPREAEGIE